MMNFRLTFFGPAGFDYKGFNTMEELLAWVKRETQYGLITPKNSLRYNPKEDRYQVVGEFIREL